ncbi:MAG: protein-L-isoaspartate O-methyltransferase family protein, partial [Halolamina sp.]
ILREDMVDGLEHALGSLDEAVNVAMRTVPRHEFVAQGAYDNRPTEHEGTRVLAPSTVARMLSALEPAEEETVLIVGAGVGYTAAVLAEIVGPRNVHAIDIARQVVYDARANLSEAGYDAVLVDCRNGDDGLPEYAPYDRVLLEAAAVEPPRALLEQLDPDGRLVMPLGGNDQTLAAIEHADDDVPDDADRVADDAAVVERFGPVALGPMLVDGEQAGVPHRNRTEREDREFARQGYFARSGWEYDWVDWEDHL